VRCYLSLVIRRHQATPSLAAAAALAQGIDAATHLSVAASAEVCPTSAAVVFSNLCIFDDYLIRYHNFRHLLLLE